MISGKSFIIWTLTLCLLISVAFPGNSQARVKPSSGFDMFSAEEEVQAGKQAAADARKQLPLLPDSDPVTQYVQQLGKKLVAHAAGEKWPSRRLRRAGPIPRSKPQPACPVDVPSFRARRTAS